MSYLVNKENYLNFVHNVDTYFSIFFVNISILTYNIVYEKQ
jgi:hypothetical protein